LASIYIIGATLRQSHGQSYVHFGDIPHTFILHFTLCSAEKIRKNFPQITAFRILQNTSSPPLKTKPNPNLGLPENLKKLQSADCRKRSQNAYQDVRR